MNNACTKPWQFHKPIELNETMICESLQLLNYWKRIIPHLSGLGFNVDEEFFISSNCIQMSQVGYQDPQSWKSLVPLVDTAGLHGSTTQVFCLSITTKSTRLSTLEHLSLFSLHTVLLLLCACCPAEKPARMQPLQARVLLISISISESACYSVGAAHSLDARV